MASEYHRILLVVLLLSFLNLVFIEVKAVDNVYISDEFNGNFTDRQNAFVIQYTNHTFQCLATSTSPIVLMRWELFDGNSGRFLNHSEGYPMTVVGDTLGQIWFYPDLDMTDHILRCRVEDDRNIDREIVFKVQVPPENVTMFDSDEPDGYQPNAVVTLTQDKEYSVQCLVRATTPACNVAWTIDDNVKDVISVNEDDPRLVNTISTTTFIPQRSHHETFLECYASISDPNIGDIPSPPVSMWVQLKVDGPPDTPYFTGSSSQVEHEIFQIQCRAVNAFPTASLRWYLDNIDITTSARETYHSDRDGRFWTFSILTYTLTRVHNHQEIRCDAHHETLSSPLQSNNLTMNVEFCPTSTTISYSETQSCPTSLVEGDTVTLTCKSSSSNPNSTIVWYANEQEQTSQYFPTQTRSDNNGWATELKFTSHPFTPEDVGIQIKCCADTEDVCLSALCSDICKPDVYYAPVFQEIEIPQDPKLEGESALLTCDVIASPQPDGFVKWQKDETIIEGSFDEDRGRLIYNIQEITRHDAGTYMCFADNGIGSSSSQPKNLTVIYRPSLLEQNNPKTVYKGNRVELFATIRSNPISVVNWTSPTGPIPPNGDERYDVETTMIEPGGYEDDVRGTTVLVKLVIKSVSRSNDTGTFSCNVINTEGDLPVTFTIVVGNESESDFSVIIISSCSALAVIVIMAVVGMLIFRKRKNGSTCEIHFPKLRRNDNESDDSFDEDIDDEDPAVYVNTTIEPEKPTPLYVPPGPYQNTTVGRAKEIEDDQQAPKKIQKPLPRPKPSKRPKSSKNPISDENRHDSHDSGSKNLKYSEDDYLYPQKHVEGNFQHVIYQVDSEKAGQNNRKHNSAIYDPVTPGVPDVVPMKKTTKIPLKPPSIASKPSLNIISKKDYSKPSGDNLQSQLAKALEMRKTNDTNV